MKFQQFIFAAVLAIPFFLLFGCEGEPGNPGVDYLPEDRYPPTVEIILPFAEREIYDQNVVEVVMVDDDTITSYEFLLNGTPNTTDFQVRRLPSLFQWDASGLPQGRHTLQLRARDQVGKVGESTLLYLTKGSGSAPETDTLRYFTDSTRMVATEWKLPTDSSSGFAGLGVRFTTDRPSRLTRVYTKILRKQSWNVHPEIITVVDIRIFSEKNGLPDTLIASRPLNFRGDQEGGAYNDWVQTVFRPSIPVPGEFFVVATLSDTTTGDTLAIQSDDGSWANGHGLILKSNGEWITYTNVRGRKPNPLIYTAIIY